MDDKDEFMIKLGGKSELKRILNRLAKKQDLLRIEINEIVSEAILLEHGELTGRQRATMRIIDQMPGQHRILFDTDCEKSPYGMHGKADKSVLTSCVWCHIELEYP